MDLGFLSWETSSDNLLHKDISGEITSDLIKDLRYDDYKGHPELINLVNRTFEAAKKIYPA